MVAHRLRQFLEAGARPTDDDLALGREWLPPALFDLFRGQHPRDVVHSANTARWLLLRGHDDPDLLQSALLHDIGKGWQRRGDRAAHVLVSWARFGGVVACADSRLEVRRALARTREHAATGAALIAAAGGSQRVAQLTRLHHQSSADDPVLALLMRADAAS